MSSDIERKVVQFEESINFMQNQLEFFSKVLEDKVGKDDVKRLTSDKVTKEDLVSLLPNEELTLEKTRYIVREEMD